jgi:hypothetical protein
MQRAAASAAISTSAVTTNRPPAITHTSDSSGDTRPSPKRQKLSNQSASPIPSADLEAISAAIKAEEDKRTAAVSRQAAEAGETEWVLKFPAGVGGTGNGSVGTGQPSVVPAGSLDAIGIDDDMECGGRRSYGNFKPKKRIDVCIFS